MRKIVDVKVGETDIAVIAEIVLEEAGSVKYTMLVDVDGIPNYYNADRSLYDVNFKEDDDEVRNILDPYFDQDAEDYEEIGDNAVYAYLAYIVNIPQEEFEGFRSATIGKCIEEINIPDFEEW